MRVAPVEEYVGRSFGDRVVLGPETLRGQQRYWYCRCSCGKESYVNAYVLVGGGGTQCRSCSRTRYRRYGAIGAWSVRKLEGLRKTSPHAVTVTVEYLDQIWRSQQGRCAYTGAELTFIDQQGSSQTASLDRIDSHVGYVPDNVQWVHKDVNIMKNKFSHDYFVATCKLIADHD